MRYRISIALLAVLLISIARAGAETITITTYNVEHFASHFEAQHLTTQKFQKESDENKEIVENIRHDNDRINWATAETILNPAVNPDVIVFEECCNQKDLEYFNHRWLKDAYKEVIVFPSNTERDQYVAMMIKPGFKIIDKKDQYYKEKDSVAKHIVTKSRGEPERVEDSPFLFARGPAFVLLESPGGFRFWVGTNHMKSKYGNGPEVTQWRNREAKRIHEIMVELSKAGPSDLVFLGDTNDEYGLDGEFEKENGGDSIANLLGPESDGFVLATKPLIEKGEISFGGYWNPKYRSFIDHVFVSPSWAPQIKNISVFKDNMAPVASDHFPVTIKLESQKAGATAIQPPPNPMPHPAEIPAAPNLRDAMP